MRKPSHPPPCPKFTDLETKPSVFETSIKVVDLQLLIVVAARLVYLVVLVWVRQ